MQTIWGDCERYQRSLADGGARYPRIVDFIPLEIGIRCHGVQLGLRKRNGFIVADVARGVQIQPRSGLGDMHGQVVTMDAPAGCRGLGGQAEWQRTGEDPTQPWPNMSFG